MLERVTHNGYGENRNGNRTDNGSRRMYLYSLSILSMQGVVVFVCDRIGNGIYEVMDEEDKLKGKTERKKNGDRLNGGIEHFLWSV